MPPTWLGARKHYELGTSGELSIRNQQSKLWIDSGAGSQKETGWEWREYAQYRRQKGWEQVWGLVDPAIGELKVCGTRGGSVGIKLPLEGKGRHPLDAWGERKKPRDMKGAQKQTASNQETFPFSPPSKEVLLIKGKCTSKPPKYLTLHRSTYCASQTLQRIEDSEKWTEMAVSISTKLI